MKLDHDSRQGATVVIHTEQQNLQQTINWMWYVNSSLKVLSLQLMLVLNYLTVSLQKRKAGISYHAKLCSELSSRVYKPSIWHVNTLSYAY